MLRTVVTENGILAGVPGGDPRITIFKGIPYAKPPIGDLRWREPHPCDSWLGVRPAACFAPISIQQHPGLDRVDFYSKELHPAADDLEMSEDCLYLNIWTPARATDEKFPVLFYIHGGGLLGGYSYEMEFDGERVARKGCILVTVAYRLGALGFLSHADLTVEAPNESQGNYGFMDQLMALKWVKRNICAFGGDPNRITIAGQSAGAGSVTALICSPLVRGLIGGAVIMSGGGPNTVSPSSISLEYAQHRGAQFLEALGVKTIAEARRLPASMICATYASMGRIDPTYPHCPVIVIDGVFMTKDPIDIMKENQLPDIAYMFGSCLDEGRTFFLRRNGLELSVESFEAHVRNEYGEHADAFLNAANVSTTEDLLSLYTSRDYFVFYHAHMAFARLMHEQGRKVYSYFFQHDIPGNDDAGSYHGSDLWFFFDSLNRSWRPFSGKHYDLARQVSSYLVNFVATGNPNGIDAIGEPLPQWDDYNAETRMEMQFGDVPQQVSQPPIDDVLNMRIEKLLRRL